jgi:hypothetical protein
LPSGGVAFGRIVGYGNNSCDVEARGMNRWWGDAFVTGITNEFFELSSTISVGGETKEGAISWKGDSGGPLFMDQHGRGWELIGVLSKGTCGSEEGDTAWYTNLFTYDDWLAELTSDSALIASCLDTLPPEVVNVDLSYHVSASKITFAANFADEGVGGLDYASLGYFKNITGNCQNSEWSDAIEVKALSLNSGVANDSGQVIFESTLALNEFGCGLAQVYDAMGNVSTLVKQSFQRCPLDCNGHGDCNNMTGVCTCDEGWETDTAACTDQSIPEVVNLAADYNAQTQRLTLTANANDDGGSGLQRIVFEIVNTELGSCEAESFALGNQQTVWIDNGGNSAPVSVSLDYELPMSGKTCLRVQAFDGEGNDSTFIFNELIRCPLDCNQNGSCDYYTGSCTCDALFANDATSCGDPNVPTLSSIAADYDVATQTLHMSTNASDTGGSGLKQVSFSVVVQSEACLAVNYAEGIQIIKELFEAPTTNAISHSEVVDISIGLRACIEVRAEDVFGNVSSGQQQTAIRCAGDCNDHGHCNFQTGLCNCSAPFTGDTCELCVSDCSGAECGEDGCGGWCGQCNQTPVDYCPWEQEEDVSPDGQNSQPAQFNEIMTYPEGVCDNRLCVYEPVESGCIQGLCVDGACRSFCVLTTHEEISFPTPSTTDSFLRFKSQDSHVYFCDDEDANCEGSIKIDTDAAALVCDDTHLIASFDGSLALVCGEEELPPTASEHIEIYLACDVDNDGSYEDYGLCQGGVIYNPINGRLLFETCEVLFENTCATPDLVFRLKDPRSTEEEAVWYYKVLQPDWNCSLNGQGMIP